MQKCCRQLTVKVCNCKTTITVPFWTFFPVIYGVLKLQQPIGKTRAQWQKKKKKKGFTAALSPYLLLLFVTALNISTGSLFHVCLHSSNNILVMVLHLPLLQ